MKRRSWLQSTAAGWLGLQSFLLHAARAPRRHALLIGVSALTHQPRNLWLQGPRNDVPAMQHALQGHGFAAEDMVLLADDGTRPAPAPGAQLPDRAGILLALTALQKRIAPGDAVVLYWSGHGVRGNGPPKQAAEADGKSTFLLACDAVRTPAGSRWPVQGAVADAEVGAFIDNWLAAGAHVLVIIDACHAASATRSGTEDIRWRGLRAAQLQELQATPTPIAPLALLPESLPSARPRPVGFAGFYACEDMQQTPEWQIDGKPHGVFSYAVIQALRTLRPNQRYSNLAQHTLDLHTRLGQQSKVADAQWPAPVFEGTLHAALWTRTALHTQRSADPTATDTPASALPAGVKVTLRATPPNGQPRLLELDKLRGNTHTMGRLAVGTQLELHIFNARRQALYVRIFHVDSQGKWHAIYPERAGDAPLLPASAERRAARWERSFYIDQAEAAPESLRWIIAPAHPQQLIHDGVPGAPLPHGWHSTVTWQAGP